MGVYWVDPEVLYAGITAVELDAAAELGFLSWAHAPRFAVDRLLDGWDTPALRDLAGEPTDERHVEEWRIAPRWRRLLDELGFARADTPERAVMLHGGHLLRLWHEDRLELRKALETTSRLREPMLPSSPITPAAWTLDLLLSELSYAEEQSDHDDVPGLRRAATAALHSLESTIRAHTPGAHG